MSDVTRILEAMGAGDADAGARLLPLVYRELRRLAADKMARERADHTLQPTALVHEAYLRLVEAEKVPRWESRRHFFGAAAEAMRRILINRARDRKRLKRGGSWRRLSLDSAEIAAETAGADLIALSDAIERLAAEDAVAAELVKLRFFGGLQHGEAAEVLGLPRRTADRCWAFARAWLYDALRCEE